MDKNFTEYYFGNRKNFIKGLGVKQDKSLEAKQDEAILRSLYFSSENMKKSKDGRKDYIKELYKTELEAIVDKKKENAKADEKYKSVDDMLERWEREYANRNGETTNKNEKKLTAIEKEIIMKGRIKQLIMHYPKENKSTIVELLIHQLKIEYDWSFEQKYLEDLVDKCIKERTQGR